MTSGNNVRNKVLRFLPPERIFYIKLGKGGKFIEDCIKGDLIKLDFRKTPHEICKTRDWNGKVLNSLLKNRKGDKREAKRDLQEIRYFYTAGKKDLWFTLTTDRLWWCFSTRVEPGQPIGTKIRKVIGHWSDKDLNGEEILKNRLSGNITMLSRFPRTIHYLDRKKDKLNKSRFDFLIARIAGKKSRQLINAEKAYKKLKDRIEVLVRDLNWEDFENLVDLVFRQTGWRRTDFVGGQQKTTDMTLLEPITKERIAVQAKSQAGLKQFEEYKRRFETEKVGTARNYFVVNNLKRDLDESHSTSNLELITPKRLAALIVDYGLSEWVINKTA